VVALVVVTANHFFLDAVTGGLTACVAAALDAVRARAIAAPDTPAPVTIG
jgi:hypothetical protein